MLRVVHNILWQEVNKTIDLFLKRNWDCTEITQVACNRIWNNFEKAISKPVIITFLTEAEDNGEFEETQKRALNIIIKLINNGLPREKLIALICDIFVKREEPQALTIKAFVFYVLEAYRQFSISLKDTQSASNSININARKLFDEVIYKLSLLIAQRIKATQEKNLIIGESISCLAQPLSSQNEDYNPALEILLKALIDSDARIDHLKLHLNNQLPDAIKKLNCLKSLELIFQEKPINLNLDCL